MQNSPDVTPSGWLGLKHQLTPLQIQQKKFMPSYP